MKKDFLREFFHRGLLSCAGGPVILAIIYAVMSATGAVLTLTTKEAATAILSITLMAFIAAGITVVYTLEQLPIAIAALIHGGVLYLDYLMIYLLNGWVPAAGIGMFTLFFVIGYLLIWAIIYLSIRRKTSVLNRKINANR